VIQGLHIGKFGRQVPWKEGIGIYCCAPFCRGLINWGWIIYKRKLGLDDKLGQHIVSCPIAPSLTGMLPLAAASFPSGIIIAKEPQKKRLEEDCAQTVERSRAPIFLSCSRRRSLTACIAKVTAKDASGTGNIWFLYKDGNTGEHPECILSGSDFSSSASRGFAVSEVLMRPFETGGIIFIPILPLCMHG
jgi:hypothetical protein